MVLGTGPQKLIRYIESNWQASRNGRADIPGAIKHNTGSEDPDLNSGVLVLRDRENVAVDQAKHDLIHCYHPEADPPDTTDNGYQEQRVVETVQIDIDITDRTDHTQPAGQQRLSAEERMVGRREYGNNQAFAWTFDVTFQQTVEEMEYRGILGETRWILETARRGLSEWERVSTDPVRVFLGNSNATVSLNVELEQIARATVQ